MDMLEKILEKVDKTQQDIVVVKVLQARIDEKLDGHIQGHSKIDIKKMGIFLSGIGICSGIVFGVISLLT